VRIGESKAKINKIKVKSNKSFQVTTMTVLNALGAQVTYLIALCSIVVLTI
jgi:hypothetical protein